MTALFTKQKFGSVLLSLSSSKVPICTRTIRKADDSGRLRQRAFYPRAIPGSLQSSSLGAHLRFGLRNAGQAKLSRRH